MLSENMENYRGKIILTECNHPRLIEELPFLFSAPAGLLPPSFISLTHQSPIPKRNGLLWESGGNVELFWNKIVLTGCKWPRLNAPGLAAP